MSSIYHIIKGTIDDGTGSAFKPVIACVRQHDLGESYIMGEVTPSVWFSSEAEALLAGDRAIEAVKTTGRFPNMCQAF